MGTGFLQLLWEKPIWEGVCTYLDPWDSVTHSIRGVECAREVRAAWRMPGSETFNPFFAADIRSPFFSADVIKNCTLVGMHLKAEEGRVESNGCRTPDLGDMWRIVCPKGLIWAWSEDESVSSSGLVTRSLPSWRIGSLRGWH